MRNIVIRRNYSNLNGGLNIINSTINLENIHIENNFGEDGLNIFSNSSITAKNITIKDNTSLAAGMRIQAGKQSFYENLLFENNNVVTGVLNLFESDTTLINKLIIHNNNNNAGTSIVLEKSRTIFNNLLIHDESTSSSYTALKLIGTNSRPNYVSIVNATIAKMNSSSTAQKYFIQKDNYTLLNIYNSTTR